MTGVRVRRVDGAYRLIGDGVDEANAFLEVVQLRGLSPATVRAYAYDLLLLHRWLAYSRQRVADLVVASLLDFIAYQRALGARPSSINRRLTTAEQFHRFVTGDGLAAGVGLAGPAPHYRGRGRDRHLGLHQLRRVRRPKLRVQLEHRVVEPLRDSQVLEFLSTLRRYRDLALVYLMLFCGLRSREVLALTEADVNGALGRLRVRGKGNRERFVPMTAVLSSVIADYLRLERPTQATTGRLFVVLQGRRRGHAMTPAGLRSLFRQRRTTRTSLRNANAHRFRHTFGADMARAGVRLPILQRMMGHADARTTLQYINLSMADIAQEYMRAMEVIRRRYERDP